MLREVLEKDKKKFNSLINHPIQSWEWGEFRKLHGNKVVRLGIYKNGKLVDAIQIIFSLLPMGFKIGTAIKCNEPTKEILESLKELGERERAIFIKLEPCVIKNPKSEIRNTKSKVQNKEWERILRDHGAIPGKTLFTPTTFWIDLTKSEDELLKSFHSKTRYNIRVAEKNGVTVAEENTDHAFEEYLKLFFETTKRQGYYMHTEKYHRHMWEMLHKKLTLHSLEPIARLLIARYKGEPITAWCVFVFKDFLYYPYGGSTNKYKQVMSNNLTMWEAIKYGKKLGLKTFDLWGREEGKGFTKFKEGYNPEVVEFLGTWDLVTSPFYYPYRLAEFMRWKLLKLKSKVIRPNAK